MVRGWWRFGMGKILPIDVDNLLHCTGIEPERVEFKESWDPDRTGPQVLRTICAFANDHHNLNGGYLVIGVGERLGRPNLSPKGLSADDLAAAERWISDSLDWLDPPYGPILSTEAVDGRKVLVVWAPASAMRPHRTTGRGGAILTGIGCDLARRPSMRSNTATCCKRSFNKRPAYLGTIDRHATLERRTSAAHLFASTCAKSGADCSTSRTMSESIDACGSRPR